MRRILAWLLTGVIAAATIAAVVVPVVWTITVHRNAEKQALERCTEEFTFDYHEKPVLHIISMVKEKMYKVELFSETYYAVYIYSVENEIGYNYMNGSN